ncbi:hypothetical protein D3C87_1955440 [compost metagenome]
MAQNNPSGLEYEAINAVSGAALDEVRFSDQNASFQHRISDSNTVEARPPLAIGSSTRTISCHSVAPSRRAASRMSLGMSLK